MNTKKHGKVTMALAMIGGLAALSIAYAAISTQLNINSGDNSERVEASAVMFDDTEDACKGYGVSKATELSGLTSVSSDYEDASGKKTDNELAKCGTVEVSSGRKENDTVTISGTVLKDYGAFAVYQLTIVNKGNTPVKLKNDPNSSSVVQFTNGTDSEIKKNITINVYSDDACEKKVGAFSGEVAPDQQSTANYLLGYKSGNTTNSTTKWYVKVAHRAYGSTEYSGSDPTDSSGATTDITSGSFGFTITPVWENA